MRAKQLAVLIPARHLKLVWNRLTFSKLTTAYVVFSLCHCILQVGLQIRAFAINEHAATFLSSIAVQANATDDRIPALSSSDLYLCDDVPTYAMDYSQCQIIWNGTAKSNSVATSSEQAYDSSPSIVSTSSTVSSSPSTASSPLNGEAATLVLTQTITSTPTVTVVIVASPTNVLDTLDHHDDDHDDDNDDDDEELEDDDADLDRRSLKVLVFDQDGQTKVKITGEGYDNTEATLSSSCLWSLNWPISILENTKREDIVFIAFQFWVLGMSIVALLNESMPHMIASLLTHLLATGWSTFQVYHTADFRSTFNRVIANGACNGVSLLPGYWTQRANAEYPTLAFNVVALFISAFLTWKLIKAFGWQTFKRVGASLTINRIYKMVLVLSIVLQLSFFFMAATVGLWLDSLFNGIASQVAWYVTLYKASSFATLVLLIPWIATGWFAVRQEMRLAMFIFLLLSLLYLGGWSVMFLSDTFRWMFLTWKFFTMMAVASVSLTLVAFILGVVCRYNFGKGLPRYLNAQEPLPGDDFTPVMGSDLEKVDFPSNEKPIPTFSATFGSGDEVPVPSQMFRATRLGPRFYNPSIEPFETPSITQPSTILTRSSSRSSDNDSFGTMKSYYSYSSPVDASPKSETHGGKRWVIE